MWNAGFQQRAAMTDQLTDRAYFSPLLNQIADCAGIRAALLLGRDKACQRIYIPAKISPGHWLLELLGDEACARVIKEFGGQQLDIPPALGGQIRRRRRAIIQMSKDGWSINQIAGTLGVARSTVTDTRRDTGLRVGGTQKSLFDD